MKKSRLYTFLMLLASFATLSVSSVSCTDDEKDDNGGNNNNNNDTVDTIGTRVFRYFCFSYTPNDSSKSCAAYYCDSLVVLQAQSNNGAVYANAIYVDSTDVYVAGSDNSSAVYWRNGAIHYLPEGAYASDIVVKNGHVYVCGTGGGQARYWVDDTPAYSLADGYSAEGIDVDNDGNIYIVGYNTSGDVETLRYWTGTAGQMSGFNLSAESSENACEGRAIALDYTHYDDNGHPYICIASLEYSRAGIMAKQWVNRRYTTVNTSSGNDMTDVMAVGGKLYTCGKYGKMAYYWVSDIANSGACNNLVATKLSDGSDEVLANALYVFEGKVYVVGTRTKDFTPYYWINGTETALPISVTSLGKIEMADICVVRCKVQ